MNTRALVLPALAVALVSGVLGVQAANGGGDFVPARTEDPCVPRQVTAASTTSIDALGELLVLYGLDGAACRLRQSRESLVLEFALPGARTDAQIEALRGGLLDAVERMKAADQLPAAADLAEEALAEADLNALLKRALQALPDGVINGVLPTDDVLRRAINDLDLRALLADLADPAKLQDRITAAVTEAVKDSLVARLKSVLPG